MTSLPLVSVQAGVAPQGRQGAPRYKRLVLASYLADQYQLGPFGSAVLAGSIEAEFNDQGDPDHAQDADHVHVRVVAVKSDTSAEVAAQNILQENPDFLGLSLYVWNYVSTIALIEELQVHNPEFPIVVGGPHVSRDDEELQRLLREGKVTTCVSGEGEAALAYLFSLPPQDLPQFLEGQNASFTSIQSPYITQEIMRDELKRTQTAIVEGARGCPFSCTFCDQGWRKARLASFDELAEELRKLYDLGARHFIFLDPTFNFDRARMHRLLDFLRDELPGSTFSAELKVDMLRPEDIEALSGVCSFVEAGLQTIHVKSQKLIKRREKVDVVLENCNRLIDAGIEVVVNTIYGLPGETFDEWLQTIDKCYAETAAEITSGCLKVLPNTEIWDHRHEFGYVWDPDRMFRALYSSAMSGEDFERASRLSRLLGGIQRNKERVLPQARSYIAQNNLTLSEFLIGLERETIALRQTRDSDGETFTSFVAV
ncbi:B12-binding domain-containing radical SAM protein [Streptomyces sp. WAC01280]|uniref:B12-binding domain-containing radical SAM protein n=1 Tax=Streptomyces sp. WAC01280 TaxID=2487424 RepID=UPI000F7AC934|nr:radical SAM protein [Streptomyces sp. WAC01280]RSS55093.1 radical SAM protein [Streptomyces sp. WAC01280]